MIKRSILFGDYDTAATGLWTLTAWTLSPAKQKTNIIEVPASDVVLDLSTALTDGEPRYSPRTLTVTLESSEGDRLARKTRIDDMVNELNGLRVKIVLPDDPHHYLNGTLSVQELYNDLAHASVQVDAICEPWKYSTEETLYTLQVTEDEQTVTVTNTGRRSVVPILTVSGGSVHIIFNGSTYELSPGTYQAPEVHLTKGSHPLTYSGAGLLEIKYREAVL